jgi:hypothetical protein
VPSTLRLIGTSLVAASGLLVACGGSGTLPAQPYPNQPPPKPGSSITHTQMCSCRRCEPRYCCTGANDRETGNCSQEDARVDADGYDFTKSEECGMAVGSCVGRCAQHVWRIKLTEACEATRPDVCCR